MRFSYKSSHYLHVTGVKIACRWHFSSPMAQNRLLTSAVGNLKGRESSSFSTSFRGFDLLFSKAMANHCLRLRWARQPIQPGATMSNRQNHHSDHYKNFRKLPLNIQMAVCLVASVLRRWWPGRNSLRRKTRGKLLSWSRPICKH